MTYQELMDSLSPAEMYAIGVMQRTGKTFRPDNMKTERVLTLGGELLCTWDTLFSLLGAGAIMIDPATKLCQLAGARVIVDLTDPGLTVESP